MQPYKRNTINVLHYTFFTKYIFFFISENTILLNCRCTVKICGLTGGFSGIFAGGEGLVNKQEDEDEYLNLLYDPCLNCYFDPKTGKYYELA